MCGVFRTVTPDSKVTVKVSGGGKCTFACLHLVLGCMYVFSSLFRSWLWSYICHAGAVCSVHCEGEGIPTIKVVNLQLI